MSSKAIRSKSRQISRKGGTSNTSEALDMPKIKNPRSVEEVDGLPSSKKRKRGTLSQTSLILQKRSKNDGNNAVRLDKNLPPNSETPSAKLHVNGLPNGNQVRVIESREAALSDTRFEATHIMDQHDDKVRQLFHLEKFVTMVDYDPATAKSDSSEVFLQFKQPFELWATVAESKSGGATRSTRRQTHQRSSIVDGTNVALSQKITPTVQAKLTNHKRPHSEQSSSKRPKNDLPNERNGIREANRDTEISPNSSAIVVTRVPAKKISRLKIRLRVPTPTITHPYHVPIPKKFEQFRDYLSSFKSIGDEDISREAAEAKIIVEAAKRGRIANLENLDGSKVNLGNKVDVKKQVEPPRQSAHRDFFISHVLNFSKLQSDERRRHISQAKKISLMVHAHFKRAVGDKERDEKQEEKRLRQIAKRTAHEVRKKWKLAEKIVLQRRLDQIQEQQRVAGRAHLDKILEQSTQLLEAQRDRSPSATPSLILEDSSDSSDENDSENLSETGDSSSEKDSVNEPIGALDVENNALSDDEVLPLDRLKEKYSFVLERDSLSRHASEERSRVDASSQEESINNETSNPMVDIYEDNDNLIAASGSETDITMDSERDKTEETNSGSESVEPSFSLAALYDDANTRLETSPRMGEQVIETHPEIVEETQVDNSDESNIKSQDHSVDLDIANIDGHDEQSESSTVMDSELDSASEASDDTSAEDVGLAALFTNGVNGKAGPIEKITPEKEDKEVVNGDRSDINMAEENVPAISQTKIPELLRGTLREYQHQGLDWLAGLYNNSTNGILADEMGLGKTIQTIALLAYLACEKGVWGPHLIIVPTSVILNWEMELKRFAPGFKILTYYGNPQQRKIKRRGWHKMDTWHICITSYQLVLQDHQPFRKKKWCYMILDEAHNIKNFRSQRWQALLNFRAERRLLLTGTPLQNNLMELWSLLYFLMPSGTSNAESAGFANLREFQEWFSHPVDRIVEGKSTLDNESRLTIGKLHQVLRPYLLRRIKAEVEKQMPGKFEHVVYCRLSKRQRYLYDDFMSRAQTRETLASGNYLSIINCLMQLRKVCNHPDLFEVRQIVTSFSTGSQVALYAGTEKLLRGMLLVNGMERINLECLNLVLNSPMSTFEVESHAYLDGTAGITEMLAPLVNDDLPVRDLTTISGHTLYSKDVKRKSLLENLQQKAYINARRVKQQTLIPSNLIKVCQMDDSVVSKYHTQRGLWSKSMTVSSMILDIHERAQTVKELVDVYGCITPAVVVPDLLHYALSGISDSEQAKLRTKDNPLHRAQVKLSIAFPDKRLLQYDCGKLQKLDELLRELLPNGHRALIFTQMTKMLDILEEFLSIHGIRYMRLDGATKIEQRQLMTERFNSDPRVSVFILSTRSGGLGINLMGADTVIFYDSDWNPAMDKQCQDRAHRIGQTREVHIYRFVSESTIESNILLKANQKRMLDNVVIQEGDFTTDYLSRLSLDDMLSSGDVGDANLQRTLATAEDADDADAAKVAFKEATADDAIDFEAPSTPLEVNEIGHIDDYMIRFLEWLGPE